VLSPRRTGKNSIIVPVLDRAENVLPPNAIPAKLLRLYRLGLIRRFVAKVPIIPAVVSMNGSANKQKGRCGFLPLTGLKAVVEKGSGDQ
jgi:hypothetical protein